MRDEQALLRAVLADPADDTPRLVYADWLQDHDQAERAEFIRVQLELSRKELCSACHEVSHLGTPAGSACRCGGCLLNERVRVLFNRNCAAWFGSLPGSLKYRIRGRLPGFDTTEEITYWFDRGFAEVVRCPAAVWIACADLILAAHPVRKVSLTTLPTDVEMVEVCFRGPSVDPVGFPGYWASLQASLMQDIQSALDPGGGVIYRSANEDKTVFQQHWKGIEFESPQADVRSPPHIE